MNKDRQSHILFSLSLFLLFVIGSFFVVTYEIRGYQSIHDTCTIQDQLSTPIAYLNTKLKANDKNQSTSIVYIDNVECLAITTPQTVTYIYLQDGYLKELYMQKDGEVKLKDGSQLFELDDFVMKNENNLFSFTLTKSHESKSIDIYLHG